MFGKRAHSKIWLRAQGEDNVYGGDNRNGLAIQQDRLIPPLPHGFDRRLGEYACSTFDSQIRYLAIGSYCGQKPNGALQMS